MARAFEVSGIGLDELVGGHVFHVSRSLHFLLLLGLAALLLPRRASYNSTTRCERLRERQRKEELEILEIRVLMFQ